MRQATHGELDSGTYFHRTDKPKIMSEIDDVCVVTHPIGSASESHAETLLDILGALTEVSLVAISVAEESPLREEYDTIEVSGVDTGGPIPIAALRFLANQLRMAMILRNRPENIVLFFGVTAYLLPILAAKLAGKTVVLQPRGNVPLTLRLHWERRLPDVLARGLAGVVWSMERLGYHAADAIITYTPSMAEELGLDRFEEKLYPNGARYVDADEFYPRVPFGERDKVVGFLGRLDEEKNVRTLASVAKELPDDVTFRFIGDGDLREELERELAAEIEAGKVEFTGWVDHDEVPQQLSELRLLVLPSEPTEGLPTVILEAMACATPVYATPVAGVPDVVREGETGFLLKEVDRDRLVEEISSRIKAEPLGVMSESGRRVVEEEYSFQAATHRYRVIMQSISQTS